MSAAVPGKMQQAPASTWQVPEARAVAVDSEDLEPKKQALVPDVEKILVAGELVAVSRARNDVEEKDERVKINRVENYHGSSAAASSDFFDLYRRTRTVEINRLEKMDRDHQQKMDALAFQQKRIDNFHKDQGKLEKNRAKRAKKKENQKAKRNAKKRGGEDRSDSESGDEEANPAGVKKFRRIDDGDERMAGGDGRFGKAGMMEVEGDARGAGGSRLASASTAAASASVRTDHDRSATAAGHADIPTKREFGGKVPSNAAASASRGTSSFSAGNKAGGAPPGTSTAAPVGKSAGSTVGIGAMKLGGFGGVDVPDPGALDFADLAAQVAKPEEEQEVPTTDLKEGQRPGLFKHQQNIILKEDTDI
eukprot:g16308.t1